MIFLDFQVTTTELRSTQDYITRVWRHDTYVSPILVPYYDSAVTHAVRYDPEGRRRPREWKSVEWLALGSIMRAAWSEVGSTAQQATCSVVDMSTTPAVKTASTLIDAMNSRRQRHASHPMSRALTLLLTKHDFVECSTAVIVVSCLGCLEAAWRTKSRLTHNKKVRRNRWFSLGYSNTNSFHHQVISLRSNGYRRGAKERFTVQIAGLELTTYSRYSYQSLEWQKSVE